MKPLYHYTTWAGDKIHERGLIVPSIRYAPSVLRTTYPPLVFLTFNEWWEPSVQAGNDQKHWEKCGSCPAIYAELEIPCWRFEVKPFGIKRRQHERYWHLPYWGKMVGEAVAMKSDPDQWLIAESPVRVKRVFKWKNDWGEIPHENRHKTFIGQSPLPWWSSLQE